MTTVKACFVAIGDVVDESFEDLVHSIEVFCPGAAVAWYDSGRCRDAPDGLERVVPHRPLKRWKTTPAFFDIFEWAAGRDYDCVVNVDAELAFVKPGFLDFVAFQLRDTDYLATGLRHRVPRISMWPPYRTLLGAEREELAGILGIEHVNRAFGTAQVFGRRYIDALLASDRYPRLRDFAERNQRPGHSHSLPELLFPTLADSLGVRSRGYPGHLTALNRFRPFQSELDLAAAHSAADAFFLSPVRRSAEDPVRAAVRENTRPEVRSSNA
ncbi:hypothetical protein [Actinoplanes utahensis]|uniref:DUF5672 domain-containing protein n=1 Tax=Actinoplanes utahensis TaxID=1869 RepID=A0A0A6UP63_ACTUT|nr:hypothetical protein [Actinoplanes utahensis]KHD76833.1 hypothetical protein MB27_14970 [Actinoplanes utahensis]GIF33420.1 hypothetical protein Aut01nite_64060 [Actinoplanes utahensis]